MRARYFIILAVGTGLIAIVGLRANATHSLNLRNAITSADIAGESVTAPINQLRDFVFSHMNSSVRFELTGSYRRAVEKAWAGSVDPAVYATAQATCDRPGASYAARIDCVENYLGSQTGASTEPPPRSQYTYAFAAPSWSPDLAGLGLLVTISLTITALVVYLIQLFRSRAAPSS